MEAAHTRRLCRGADAHCNSAAAPSVRHDTVNHTDHGARLTRAEQYKPVTFDCTVSPCCYPQAQTTLRGITHAPRHTKNRKNPQNFSTEPVKNCTHKNT
jgi:hypothetical protein